MNKDFLELAVRDFVDAVIPPGRPTVGRSMSPPLTTVEPEAHHAAAACSIEYRRASAPVVTTDDTHERIAMTTDAEITEAVADGRDLGSS